MKSRVISKSWVLVLLTLATLSSVVSAVADHLPREQQASGRPEKRLAGVLLDVSKVADVIKMYGEPSEVIEQPKPSNLKVVSTYDYYWRTHGAQLHLIVYRGSEIKGGEYIALIEVEGSPEKSEVGRTGAGLKLGDGMADLRRIYGRRYRERNLPKLIIHDVMVQWRSEEFSLVAELNSSRKITKLSLSAPE